MITKSIHSTFLLKSLFAAGILCFSLALTEIIVIKYINLKEKHNYYYPFINLSIRIPLVIILSEIFFYLYYYNDILD